MAKVTLRSLAAVGIVYRQSDPAQVLLNMVYGRAATRDTRFALKPLGGEFSPQLLGVDIGPRDSFKEVVLTDLMIDLRDGSVAKGFTPAEASMFYSLRKAVVEKSVPWRDYLVTPAPVWNGTQNSSLGQLVSYFLSGLDESDWAHLEKTLGRFDNISKSGLCHITSYNEIIRQGQTFAFGHDTALVDFWLERGYGEASQIKRRTAYSAKRMDGPLTAYRQYLSLYDFK